MLKMTFQAFIKAMFVFLLLSISNLSNASYKVYEAELSESKWLFDGNPLGCQLTHQVPFYGDATFSKQPGINKDLEFNLSYKRQSINSVKVASIQSLSPAWLPQQQARHLGEVPINKGSNIFSTTNIASWKLLNELEVGRFPTFRYQEFDSIEDQVAVSISAVGFKQPYDQFLDCLTTLVPYKLDELMKMTLLFDFDKSSIRQKYQDKLKALAAYVKYDPSLEIVFIHGYTDNKGSRGYNQRLSEKRVASVQKLLMSAGGETSQFKTMAYGEKNPAASNRKAKGRALNRRVYIRVSQK